MKPVIRYGTPFWVIGQPVDHTLSPVIHNSAFEESGMNHRYFAQEVAVEELEEFFKFLDKLQLPGANITLPLKEKATSIITGDRQDDTVKKTGAANTVYRENKRLKLANTDVYGFKKLIERWEKIIQKEPVLLLGAGGAARACLAGLEELDCREVYIWNRTEEKAQHLKDQFSPPVRQVLNREELEKSMPPVKMVINATSIGLKNGDPSLFPAENIGSEMIGVDLIYNRETRFMEDFFNGGKIATGGLPMLVHQAGRAWQLWLNKKAPTDVMFRAARRKLS